MQGHCWEKRRKKSSQLDQLSLNEAGESYEQKQLLPWPHLLQRPWVTDSAPLSAARPKDHSTQSNLLRRASHPKPMALKLPSIRKLHWLLFPLPISWICLVYPGVASHLSLAWELRAHIWGVVIFLFGQDNFGEVSANTACSGLLRELLTQSERAWALLRASQERLPG